MQVRAAHAGDGLSPPRELRSRATLLRLTDSFIGDPRGAAYGRRRLTARRPLSSPTQRFRSQKPRTRTWIAIALAIGALVAVSGCSSSKIRTFEVTAYCACSECTDWERGNWRYLKLDFWNRYVSKGPDKGRIYTGRTASGTK